MISIRMPMCLELVVRFEGERLRPGDLKEFEKAARALGKTAEDYLVDLIREAAGLTPAPATGLSPAEIEAYMRRAARRPIQEGERPLASSKSSSPTLAESGRPPLPGSIQGAPPSAKSKAAVSPARERRSKGPNKSPVPPSADPEVKAAAAQPETPSQEP